jgi:YidC/Oxa1 family membrane protein insertase
MKSDQRNLLLAVILTLGILAASQYWLSPPLPPPAALAPAPAALATSQAGNTGPSPVSPVQTPQAEAVLPAQALAKENARIPINSTRLHGSVTLKGARLDDLTLAQYRETLSPQSNEVRLLIPEAGYVAGLENKTDIAKQPYYADFGWVNANSSQPLLLPDAATIWQSSGNLMSLTPQEPVILWWDNGAGIRFEREIRLDEDYLFTVKDRVYNQGKTAIALHPYGLIARSGEPEILDNYILHEGPLGYLGGALKEVSYNKLREEPIPGITTTGGWIGITDKYWLTALIPPQKEEVKTRFLHSQVAGLPRTQVDFIGGARQIAPGQVGESEARFFAGAKEVSLLERYREAAAIERFDLAVDFGLFYFLTKSFFHALAFFNGLVGNFGVAIMLLTICVRLVLFPLAHRSFKMMTKMKALQPEVARLREMHANDRMGLQQAMMQLYRVQKVNPISGCLPILVQIPVFFALYKVLFVTIEMRHAPFFGWIQDLSAPDPTNIFTLFGLVPITLPSFAHLGIWPILMGITMYVQQKLNPPPPDPVQARIFMLLPILFTFMLGGFAAGLVIYWTWNNTLSILQQYSIMRSMGVPIGAAGAQLPVSEHKDRAESKGQKAGPASVSYQKSSTTKL